MRYVKSRYEQNQRELTYRIYLTDALMAISENTGGGKGSHMTQRWYELVEKPVETVEDTRTVTEIVDGIWANIDGQKRGESK